MLGPLVLADVVLDPVKLIVIPTPHPLEPLHLPRLQFLEILLAKMDPTKLITHCRNLDILLRLFHPDLALPHRLLEHRLVGLSDPADAEVHPRPHLLDLDAREPLAGPLRADEVHAQAQDRRGAGIVAGRSVAAAALVVGRDDDDVLQALDVDLVCAGRGGVAAEEVGQHALGQGELVGDGGLEGGAGEDEHGPQADGELLGLELAYAAEGLAVEVELEHVEHLVAEGAGEGDCVGALLGGGAEDEDGGVVLLREELERGGVLEGVDGVLLRELLGEGLAEGVELREGILGDLGAGGAAEEEGDFGVFGGFGLFLLQGALGAGVAGFAVLTLDLRGGGR